jgi:hypothetical protein
MGNNDLKSSLQQDRPERRVYRLTADGRETKARPSGRVSRGFLRLLSVLDGKQDLQSIQVQLTFLTIADLVLWCEELTRLKLIERIDLKDVDTGFSYTGGIDFERDPEFNSAVEQICAALDRTQPMAERSRNDAPRFVTAHTARLVAIEALNTTRNMTLNGFFAYPSRRVDGKIKPSEFRILRSRSAARCVRTSNRTWCCSTLTCPTATAFRNSKCCAQRLNTQSCAS